MSSRGAHVERWVATLALAALSGCAAPPAAVDPGGCPQALRSAVVVSVSVSPIARPNGALAADGAVPQINGTARRLLLAVHVARSAPRVQLLGNALELLTYGGTLDGWARVLRPRGAERRESLAADDGWLEITPFLSGAQLHSRTETLAVGVVPGGHPRAILAVRPAALWSLDGRPRPARNLALQFRTVSHMTRLHAVDATATFHFRVQHLRGAHEQWQCSIERNFTLLTRREGLPDLWVLRAHAAAHAPWRTLAVSDPKHGAFALVFLDPQSARAFARWVRQQHTDRLRDGVLGMIGAADHFVALSARRTGHLHTRQWGEP